MPAPDWDARYAGSATGLFGDRPNDYLRTIVARDDFAARSALCLADGDGRNGRFLAGLGLEVLAVDGSSVATEKGRGLDKDAGLQVERLTADLASWAPPPRRRFEAVVVLFLHCEPRILDTALRQAVEALTPGGWVIIEGFAKAQAADPAMGPDQPTKLYDRHELRAALQGLHLVESLEGRVLLDEGRSHQGEAEIVRLALRKPG